MTSSSVVAYGWVKGVFGDFAVAQRSLHFFTCEYVAGDRHPTARGQGIGRGAQIERVLIARCTLGEDCDHFVAVGLFDVA